MKKITLLTALTFIVTIGTATFVFSLIKNSGLWTDIMEGHYEEAALERIFQNEKEELVPANAVKVPIFIYHSVRPHIPKESRIQDEFDITPELFEAQLAYLNDHNFTTITPHDLAGYFGGKFELPPKPVILTFDDGWANQYKHAFPLLKKYNARAIFYVYTNAIGKPHFFSWSQIKELDAAHMTIGSHTLSHPFFRNTALSQVRVEAVESKKIMEKELGKPVTDFASPFGYSNEAIQAILKEAGYETARTTYKGVYHSKDDLLRLRGVLVNDSLSDFIAVLNRQ